MKTLVDLDHDRVNLTPVTTTIPQLSALPKPTDYPQRNRMPTELTTYRVRARLVDWFTEDDRDFHIIIADPTSGATMIAEIPDPECALGSGHQHEYAAARATVESLANGSLIDVVGVAFFDIIHGQRGVAPNGVELHPILSLTPISRN